MIKIQHSFILFYFVGMYCKTFQGILTNIFKTHEAFVVTHKLLFCPQQSVSVIMNSDAGQTNDCCHLISDF